MRAPIWVPTSVLIDIHTEHLALFGGPPGIRDYGMLESALSRPQNRFAYGGADLADLAAAYAFGIARNHPFVDGNKRSAFAAMIVFLGLNDVDFRVDPAMASAAMISLAAGEIDEQTLAAWIRDNLPAR